MFNPPCKLEHLTELFQSLCDAAMDLDPQSLAGKIPENLLECAHLVALADISVVRECASVAEQLSNAEPYQIASLVVEHHQKITFQQEYLGFLKKFEIEFKDEYVFNWIAD